jgi:hypothetical protein
MTSHRIQVTQHELRELCELQRDVAEKEKRIEELKSNIKALLIAKIPIEAGRFYARLFTRTVHHVAWKQAVIDNLGFEFAESFRKDSPSSILCDVIVEEYAGLPLWKGSSETPESEN